MKVYVGVTDQAWFEFLSARPDIGEVNFWRPYGSRNFKVLQAGEPFLFKTKFPQNRVVGGGIFEGFVSLNISRAWEFFGLGNGVASPEDLVERIHRITGEASEEIGDREIGCILLRNVTFLPHDRELPSPTSFSVNIVQGKSYEFPGEDDVVDIMVNHLLASEILDSATLNSLENLSPARGEPRLMTPRLGQNAFKAVVQEAYVRRCAITDHKILPTLQAAHIFPVAAGGQHRVDNGLLLRSDVHTMFDQGYLSIDQDFRLCVSQRLRTEFGNGSEFYSKEGSTISLPTVERNRPSLEYLSWHFKTVFH
jgi:putative restriction endonuclease